MSTLEEKNILNSSVPKNKIFLDTFNLTEGVKNLPFTGGELWQKLLFLFLQVHRTKRFYTLLEYSVQHMLQKLFRRLDL